VHVWAPGSNNSQICWNLLFKVALNEAGLWSHTLSNCKFWLRKSSACTESPCDGCRSHLIRLQVCCCKDRISLWIEWAQGMKENTVFNIKLLEVLSLLCLWNLLRTTNNTPVEAIPTQQNRSMKRLRRRSSRPMTSFISMSRPLEVRFQPNQFAKPFLFVPFVHYWRKGDNEVSQHLLTTQSALSTTMKKIVLLW